MHVIFYMSVLGIVSEIMEDEEFQEEETNNQHDWRNQYVLTNVDIVDTMYGTGNENTRPESLYAFHTSVAFPSERFLTEREIPRVIDESEESKPSASVEWYADHAKECMGKVSEYRAEESIVDDSFMTLAGLVQIYHIFYVFCKSETKCNNGDTIHIIGDTFCFDSTSEEEPKHHQAYKSCSTSCQEYCVGVSCTHHTMDKCSNDKDIDKNNRESQRFPDTENQECQLGKFFEKCEEQNNSVLSVLLGEIESGEIALEVIDKVISFYV